MEEVMEEDKPSTASAAASGDIDVDSSDTVNETFVELVTHAQPLVRCGKHPIGKKERALAAATVTALEERRSKRRRKAPAKLVPTELLRNQATKPDSHFKVGSEHWCREVTSPDHLTMGWKTSIETSTASRRSSQRDTLASRS